MADEFDRLFKENVDLSERITATLDRIKSYEDMKETLQNTLLVAQKHAEDVESDASRHADLMVREADLKAQQIIAEALGEKQRVQQEVMRVRRAETQYRDALVAILERNLKAVDGIDVPEGFPSDEDVAATAAEADLAAGRAATPVEQPPASAAARPVAPAPAATAPAARAVAAPTAVQAAAAQPPAPSMPSYAEAVAGFSGASEPASASGAPAFADFASSQRPTPASAPARSLPLGAVASPPLAETQPVLVDPAEFAMDFTPSAGQADDDVDIEEID